MEVTSSCNDLIISTDKANVVDDTIVEVHSGVVPTDVKSLEPQLIVNDNQFVLSSSGQYSSNGLVGKIPNWLNDAIQQKLTTGDGNLTSVVLEMKSVVDTLEVGVEQVVTSINTVTQSQNALSTSISSQVEEVRADLLNVVSTKVDANQAQSIAVQAIRSEFGTDVDAYIGSIAATYVDENSAIAQNLDIVASTLGEVSSSVSDIAIATTEQKLNPLWVDDGSGSDPDANGESKYITVAKASKQLQVDANGVITGLLLESGETAAITMTADQFKLVGSGQTVASRNPFTVDATTGKITFNGSVSFNSVTDTPQMVSYNTNINTSNNLINPLGINLSNHAGYELIGSPVYSVAIGAGNYSEIQMDLALADELYTPYISDFSTSYSASYAFKGHNGGYLVEIDSSGSITYTQIVPNTVVLDSNTWYLVQILILPSGSSGLNTYGSVYRASDMQKIATLNDFVLASVTTKFLLGWYGGAQTISRPRIEFLTNDTVNINYVTADTVTNTVASMTSGYALSDMSNVTTIDGGKITTGSIDASKIVANSIDTNHLSVGAGIVNGYVQSSDFNLANETGFRLKSNAAGTFADPTIYGAYVRGGYIKGATIDGATLIGEVLNINNLKVVNSSYPLNTTNFTVYQNFSGEGGVSDYFYSASYGSGYLPKRIITNNKVVQISAFTEGGSVDNLITSITISRSIDGKAFTVISTLGTSDSYSPVSTIFIDNPVFTNHVRYSFSINSNGGNSFASIISHNIN